MSGNTKSLFNASAPMRLFMFNSSILMLIGIGLTGVEKVHWFIYFVPVFYLFAAATGFCAGLAIPRLIFDRR